MFPTYLWEGRFKSQALLGEKAVLACMAYVDLNPIRAGICDTLEASEFTSIQERIRVYSKNKKQTKKTWLKQLLQDNELASPSSMAISITDYFTLVDWTGREIRNNKRGAIPEYVKPILYRLGVNETNWVTNTQHFGSRFYRALGRINQIRKLAVRTDQQWLKGFKAARCFYQ